VVFLEEVAILDFETTGLSAGIDRPTEIAIVIVRSGKVVDKFQSLMNPERLIPKDVQSLTGITNQMVFQAPSVRTVMNEAYEFVANRPVLAHNASFDQRFWRSELEQLGKWSDHSFVCTMLLARRIYPELNNHRLSTLTSHLRLPDNGRAHRAMSDVLSTAHLFFRIQKDISLSYGFVQISHDLLKQVQSKSKSKVPSYLRHLSRLRK